MKFTNCSETIKNIQENHTPNEEQSQTFLDIRVTHMSRVISERLRVREVM